MVAMVNALRGEISATLNDAEWTLCLTLGALASLEARLGAANLSALSEKFSNGKLSSQDLLEILHAGLNGGGNALDLETVKMMRVEGGIQGYVDIVTRLLSATFTPLETRDPAS